MALHPQLQASTAMSPSLLVPTGNAGLRRLSNAFAFKSCYFSGSLGLLSHPNHMFLASGPSRISMRLASKQVHICRDCGYIYNERAPFEKLPGKYFCSVCGAPIRRFRTYAPDVTKDATDTNVRKARKAQIQRDGAIGKALPIAIVVGIAKLVGLYSYLNTKL